MNREKIKTPTSWYIWLALWILPLFFAIGIYPNDPAMAIYTWIAIGILVILMIAKPKWVLPWFCVVLIFDLIGYGALLTDETANIAFFTGTIFKDLIFIGYLLFSVNAKRHQGRLIQSEKTEVNET